MKILVIGGGGREHALVWKLAQSPRVSKIFCAPGNGGIAQAATCLPIAADDAEGLLAAAEREGVDLTIVGPEAALAAGVVDRFAAAGRRIVGPTRAAAQLETSKAFAKAFMQRQGIPTAKAVAVRSLEEALAVLDLHPLPVVIKADGLAAGKGVVVTGDRDEAREAARAMMQRRVFGAAGDTVLIEECLQGMEATCMAFTDGKTVAMMPAAQDHKRAEDGDRGPNTGGMGAYAPTPFVTDEIAAVVRDRVMKPAIAGMAAEGHPYRGILYAGVMLTNRGPGQHESMSNNNIAAICCGAGGGGRGATVAVRLAALGNCNFAGPAGRLSRGAALLPLAAQVDAQSCRASRTGEHP